MENEKEVNIMHCMNTLTFDVFIDILFGNDVEKLVSDLHPYINEDGKVENLSLRDILIRIGK